MIVVSLPLPSSWEPSVDGATSIESQLFWELEMTSRSMSFSEKLAFSNDYDYRFIHPKEC